MIRKVYILFLLCLIINSCKNDPPEIKASTPDTIPSSHVVIAIDTVIPSINIIYKIYLFDSALTEEYKAMSEDQKNIICLLNRTDDKYIFRQDSLVIPDTIVTDKSCYTFFPSQIDSLDSAKIIFVNLSAQLFAFYENRQLQRWGAISSGRKASPTPPGIYHLNWKAKHTISTIDESWEMNWYFNIDNYSGVSMHEYDLPGYPASHSCIRMTTDDAKWLYDHGDQWQLKNDREINANGTTVIVFGSYPYGERRPWRDLTSDPNALDVSAGYLLEEYKKTKVQEQDSSANVI